MSVRVHGGMTVAHAKREELASEIARVTGQGVRAVRNQLERTHGKTHLRVAFEESWPARHVELAALTAAAALDMDLADDIAGLTDLTPRQVRGRLNRVDHGKTLVGTVFANEWPGEGDVDNAGDEDDDVEDSEEDETETDDEDVEDLEGTSVADARRLDMAGAIADRTGLGLRKVRAALRAAHGNALVGNLFAEEWGAADEEDDGGDEARTHVTGTRVVGAGKPRALEAESLVSGRFRLLRSLGKGGQGEAFEALDEQLPERGVVVIKFASFDTAAREFTFAMRFRHEHICQYFDTAFDAERNRRYLVIEHGGRSLGELINDHGALAKSEAIPIIAQAAAALDYAHSKNVIHHDVSPGNVLIDDHGHVRVTDFGIAVAGTMRTVVGGNHTMVAKTSLGRHPFYAAPEMMSTGEPVRGRADQYSLALVLCSLLEGEIFTKAYRPRDYQRLDVRQNAALHRALSRKADDRFPSCVAFANALEGA
jgi:hypothetical protein